MTSPEPATTCLVVDDSRVVRKAARRILEKHGFAVREAEDGQQALAACRDTLPEAVLLDWNMPVMDGLHSCRLSAPNRPRPPRGGVLHHGRRDGPHHHRAGGWGAGICDEALRRGDLARQFIQAGLLQDTGA
ncbi:PleD family two-component system response regulator [Siccirubricoccus deserti]